MPFRSCKGSARDACLLQASLTNCALCRVASSVLTVCLLVAPMKSLMRDPFHDSPSARRFFHTALRELVGACEAVDAAAFGPRAAHLPLAPRRSVELTVARRKCARCALTA